MLLQRGKGADAGAGFGAGASGTVFGARGATTGLSRMTAIFAAIFMLNSLCLTYLFQRDARAQPDLAARPGAGDHARRGGARAPAPIDANAVPVPAERRWKQAPPAAAKALKQFSKFTTPTWWNW